ncbi:hypothetical protein ACWD4P_11830 [Kitasatospora sp. NPDC002543]
MTPHDAPPRDPASLGAIPSGATPTAAAPPAPVAEPTAAVLPVARRVTVRFAAESSGSGSDGFPDRQVVHWGDRFAVSVVEAGSGRDPAVVARLSALT